jgi:hypothetical protein
LLLLLSLPTRLIGSRASAAWTPTAMHNLTRCTRAESATSRSKLAVAAFFSRSTEIDSHDLLFLVGKQPPTILLQRPNHKKQLDQQKFA